MRWIHRSQRSFSESFFLTFSSGYFLYPYSLQRDSKEQSSDSTEIRLAHSSTKYSCSSVSWSKRKHSSSSERFFPVLNGRYLLFNIALYGLPNISLQITQEQPSWTASWGESCNSVRWTNRTESSFSERFFSVLNGRYLLFHHSNLWASKYPFANSTRTALAKGFLKGKM